MFGSRLGVALALFGLPHRLHRTAERPGRRPAGGPTALCRRARTAVTTLMQQLQIPGALVFVDAPGKGTWRAALGSSACRCAVR